MQLITKIIFISTLILFFEKYHCLDLPTATNPKIIQPSNGVSSPSKIKNAIEAIDMLSAKITNESPLSKVETFKSYLQELSTQSDAFVDSEQTVDYKNAEQVAKSTFNILNRLLPLDHIWAKLEVDERLEAGRQFLTIIRTLSILVNTKLANTLRQPFTNIRRSKPKDIVFQTMSLNYNKNEILAELYSNANVININLPIVALDQSVTKVLNFNDGSKINSVITMAILPNLRQNMTPGNATVFPSIITVYLGTYRGRLKLVEPHKIKITMKKDDYLGDSRYCAAWDPNTGNNNPWSRSECNISYPNVKEMVCECDHLGTFAVLDSSVDDIFLKKNKSTTKLPTPLPQTTTSPTTPSLPQTTSTLKPTTSKPDDIAGHIHHILGNITDEGNNSTDQWKESVTKLTKLISNITSNDEIIAQVSRHQALQITNSSLDSLSRLIEAPKDIWRNLSTYERNSFSSNIFQSVSNLAILMNSKQTEQTENTVLKFSSIELQSKAFVVNESNIIHFNFNNSATTVEMPVRAVVDNFNSTTNSSLSNHFNKIATSAALLSNISQHLSCERYLLNSAVLSITVANKRESVSLNEGLKLKFVTQNNFRLVFRDRPKCSFWNLTTQHWSTSGCHVNHRYSTRSITVCECDHLTDFAALADISNREVPSRTKSILTYIFSSINCLFLVATIIFTLKYNRTKYTIHSDQFMVKTNRFWLTLSVTSWLLVSNLLLLIGMDRTEVQTICRISSLALLYSLLTAFSFSLMLSFHLYLSTSRKHHFRYFHYRNFALFAYLFPLLFIGLSVLYILVFETEENLIEMFKSLTGEYFCWISSSKHPGHIWIFVAPTTTIIIINFCLLAGILSSIRQKSLHVQVQVNRSTKEDRKGGSRENQHVNWYFVVILIFNFGFPWLLYVFYINEKMATICSYVFIVINGTQGISLFVEQIYVYNCNLNKKQQKSATWSHKNSFTYNTKL